MSYMATNKTYTTMNYNKIKEFLRILSKELDGLVTKIGVIKIALIVTVVFVSKYILSMYFNDFLFTFCVLTVIVIALFIISFVDSSKIKYLAVWGSSILAVIIVILMLLMFVYGIGESLIKTIYS